MFVRSFFGVLAAVMVFAGAAFGQLVQPISGLVEMEKDGSRVPVAGAKVDLYREDVKGQGQSVTTGADGKFAFSMIQEGQIYLISVSAPGAAPTYLEKLKPGMVGLLVTLTPGDGKSVTEDELKTAIATARSQMSEADRKKQEEFEKQRDAVLERNRKIEETTKAVEAALKAGNAAYEAKNWDVAVAKYEEGYQAQPDFVGSAPVLLNNKGTALNARAVQTYNTNVRVTDPTERRAAMNKVKEDLGNSAEAFARSWNILKNAPAADITDKAAYDGNKAKALAGVREAFRLMVATEQIDPSKGDLARNMMAEVIAAETDKAKKQASMLILADVFRVAGDSESAVAEYKKVLEADPSNLDAMAGLGISLVNQGYLEDNKEMLQEGANFLQQYASAAPDNHKFKNDAVGLIDVLKKEQNITPQRTTPTRRRN